MRSTTALKHVLAFGVAISCSHGALAQGTEFHVPVDEVYPPGHIGWQLGAEFRLLLSGSQVGVDLDNNCTVDVEVPLPFPDYLSDYPDFEHYVIEVDVNNSNLKPYYRGVELTDGPTCGWRLSYFTMTDGKLDSIYSSIMFGQIIVATPWAVSLRVEEGLEWPVNGDATNLLGFGLNAHIAVGLADFDRLGLYVGEGGQMMLSADVEPPEPESTDFNVAMHAADISTVNEAYQLEDVFSILYSGETAYVDTTLDCVPDVEITLGFADYLGEYIDPEHYVLEFADSQPTPPYFLGSELTPLTNRGWRLSYYTKDAGELGSIVSTIMSGSYIEFTDGTKRLYVADAFEWPVNGDPDGTLGYGVNAHVAARLADFKTFIVEDDTMRAEVIDACVADLNNDDVVDGADLGLLIAGWGLCRSTGECMGDITGNSVVDGADLGILIASWGPCPGK